MNPLPLPLPVPSANSLPSTSVLPPGPGALLSPILGDPSQPWSSTWSGSAPQRSAPGPSSVVGGPVGGPPLVSASGSGTLGGQLVGVGGLHQSTTQAPLSDFTSSLEARGFGAVCPPVANPPVLPSPPIQPTMLGSQLGGLWNGNGSSSTQSVSLFEPMNGSNGHSGSAPGFIPTSGIGSGVIGRKVDSHSNQHIGQRVYF